MSVLNVDEPVCCLSFTHIPWLQGYSAITFLLTYFTDYIHTDSISRPALRLLLSRLGITGKIINLMKSLYDQSVSCVRANSLQSEWFEITSGVRQGCVIAPDSFATGVDWVVDRAVGKGMNGVGFGQDAYTDLRDLRIVFFCSNRISNRPSDSFSNRIFESNRPYTTEAITQPNGLQAYRTACYRPIICWRLALWTCV